MAKVLRHKQKQVVRTRAERPPTECYALFPNPVLGEGALDGLINASHHVTLQGKSYRPQRRPDRMREVTSKKD